MKAPFFETDRYAFRLMRVGAAIVRKADNASVYFQPGDAANDAHASVCTCLTFDGDDAAEQFNLWCDDYSDLLDQCAAFNRNRERDQ